MVLLFEPSHDKTRFGICQQQRHILTKNPRISGILSLYIGFVAAQSGCAGPSQNPGKQVSSQRYTVKLVYQSVI